MTSRSSFWKGQRVIINRFLYFKKHELFPITYHSDVNDRLIAVKNWNDKKSINRWTDLACCVLSFSNSRVCFIQTITITEEEECRKTNVMQNEVAKNLSSMSILQWCSYIQLTVAVHGESGLLSAKRGCSDVYAFWCELMNYTEPGYRIVSTRTITSRVMKHHSCWMCCDQLYT